METLVWILQAVPHAIFITGLIVAGHWAMLMRFITLIALLINQIYRSWTLGNADEIYNADSTVDKSDIEIIKAEDVL